MKNPLIEIGLFENNFDDVIKKMGKSLFNAGYVNENYVESVLSREYMLPTALKINDVCIAIPHTDDVDCIKKSNVAIAVLENTVEFGSMVDPHEKLPVKVIFLLAIKDPSIQLLFLKNMVRVFRKKDIMLQLSTAKNKECVANIWKSIIDTEELKKIGI